MPPDVVLLDLHVPDQSGLEVYQWIRRIDARIPVVFVTMAKTADAAIDAIRQGAYGYLRRPLDPHHLRRVVGEALEADRRMHQPAVLAETAPDPDVAGAIVGSCPVMCEVYKAIGRVAAQDVPVLITGESSTGKMAALGCLPLAGGVRGHHENPPDYRVRPDVQAPSDDGRGWGVRRATHVRCFSSHSNPEPHFRRSY